MEHCIYQIGCRFGYRAFIDVETKKVLVIDYDTPHQSGITAYSPDGMTEPPEVETILKACVPEIYERVRNIQNGSEEIVRYAFFDKEGKQKVISFEKFELSEEEYEMYRSKGYELRPISYKEDGYHRHRIKIENGKLTFI